MTQTALVAAGSGGPIGSAATLLLAGVTLVEHQLRRLALAGIRHPVLLVDDWSMALSAPLARLRADGVAVETVHSLADAADKLGGADHVLLLADGCLPSQATVERMVQAPAPTLAVISDAPELNDYERIDADARWAGIAMLDGRRITEAAAMLGDWDAVSTLLRRAVQEGAARLDVSTEPPLLATDAVAVGAAEARLVAASRERPGNWAERHIEAPLAEALLPRLFRHRVEPMWPGIAAPALTLAAGLLALGGAPWPALTALLVAGPLARVARRLARVQARGLRWERLLEHSRLAGMALAAVGLGSGLAAAHGQWGWWLVTAAILLALPSLRAQRRVLTALGVDVLPPGLASESAMPWLLLPFALAGAWETGFQAIAAYAAGSLGWTIMRARSAVQDD